MAECISRAILKLKLREMSEMDYFNEHLCLYFLKIATDILVLVLTLVARPCCSTLLVFGGSSFYL